MDQQHRSTGRPADRAPDEAFFTPVRRPVFDPAAQFRGSAAGQPESPEAARKRRRDRRRVVHRLVGLGLLAVVGLGGWFGYPPASAKAKTFVLDAMVQEMDDVVTAQQGYRSLYGTYTTDRSLLTVAEDGFNNVRIVSADTRGFCLAGDSLLGQKRYYTPAGGTSTTPCA